MTFPDTYAWRARVAPAIVAVLPLLTFYNYDFGTLTVKVTIPTIVLAVGVAIAADLVRNAGRNLEPKLADRWGGLPTTRALRMTAQRPSLEVEGRRHNVETISGNKLPTYAEQTDDPDGSDRRIADAVKICIARIRSEGPDAALLQSENVSYGRWRNMLALKPLALTIDVVIFVAVACTKVLLHEPSDQWTLLAALVVVGHVLLYTLAVTRKRVRTHSDYYSERFFIVLSAFAASTKDRR